MPFTSQLITHRYLNSDLTPASGNIEFSLTISMSNSGVTLTPGSYITASLDASGNVTGSAGVGVSLTSTQDQGTISQGVPRWKCDERISGCPIRTFYFELPPGPGTIDLETLMPDNNVEQSTPIEAG